MGGDARLHGGAVSRHAVDEPTGQRILRRWGFGVNPIDVYALRMVVAPAKIHSKTLVQRLFSPNPARFPPIRRQPRRGPHRLLLQKLGEVRACVCA